MGDLRKKAEEVFTVIAGGAHNTQMAPERIECSGGATIHLETDKSSVATIKKIRNTDPLLATVIDTTSMLDHKPMIDGAITYSLAAGQSVELHFNGLNWVKY